MDIQGYIPLSKAIPSWPDHLLGQPDPALLSEIGLDNYTVEDGDDLLIVRGKLLWFREISTDLPGMEGFSIALLSEENITQVPFELNLLPEFRIRITEITISIRFKNDLVYPVKLEYGKWVPRIDGDGNKLPLEIKCNLGAVSFDLDGDIEMDMLEGAGIGIGAVQLGGTGIVIEINKIVPYLSRKQPPPPGADVGFKGVYIDSIIIHLPEDFNIPLNLDNISFENFTIGNTGFGGKISGIWEPAASFNNNSGVFVGDGSGDIFGLPFALKEMSIEFKQNRLISSTLLGSMLLPFFDEPIDIKISIADDGDFTIDILSNNDRGIYKLTKENIVELSVKNAGISHKNGVLAFNLSGDIKPLLGNETADIVWPTIAIKSLTIDSTGRVRIDGGWIEIPSQLSFDFFGFPFELTKIGFGQEDQYRWVGLSGGINIVDGVPFRGGVEGLKIFWKNKDPLDFKLKIGGIYVAFEIEDFLKFDGRVYFINEENSKGFKGGVRAIIYPLDGMMIDAQFMAGKCTDPPPFSYFYIYLGLELPVGIPLGSTGLAIFGMAGLFGYNASVTKAKDEAWFGNDNGSAGFYKRLRVGITPDEKWTYRRNSLAFGAGLTFGTFPDNGFLVSAKALLIILIPGPVIIIEGRANILKERGSLSEDPLFLMLAVLDFRVGTFLLNVSAKYTLPDNGLIINIYGEAEAFFNFSNPGAWHFYLGKDQPVSKRIGATVFSLFKSNAFFMLDSRSVKMGAWIGYDANWKFGPLRVILQASIEGYLRLSWKPVQAVASVILMGKVELKAFGKGIGLSVSAEITVMTPNPWMLSGKFKVKINLPWPLPDPKATVKLTWGGEDHKPEIPLTIGRFGVQHEKVTDKWELANYIDYGSNDGFYHGNRQESVPNWNELPVVPPDARPTISFTKPMEDTIGFGDSNDSPPPAEKSGEYQYNYKLTGIKLEKKPISGSGSWSVAAEVETGSNVTDSGLSARWQAIPGGSNTFTKLELWGRTPFDIFRDTYDNIEGIYTVLESKLDNPCAGVSKVQWKEVNFDKLPEPSIYPTVFEHDKLVFYSGSEIMLVTRNDDTWINNAHALTLAAVKKPKYKYNANIHKIPPVSPQTRIDHDGIIFNSGRRPSGNDAFLHITENYPNLNNGEKIFEVDWSKSQTGKARYATITFAEYKFGQGPNKVIIKCTHQDKLLLKAYTKNNGDHHYVDQAVHSNGAGNLQSLLLCGENIRKIEIIGSKIALFELTYEFVDLTRLNIPAQLHRGPTSELDIHYVKFASHPGINQIKPLYSIADKFPQQAPDGLNEVIVNRAGIHNSSESMIVFPEVFFGKGPDIIFIDCFNSQGNLYVKSFDRNDNPLESAQINEITSESRRIILKRDCVREIRLTGLNFGIREISYGYSYESKSSVGANGKFIVIAFPEPASAVLLYLARSSKCTIKTFDESGLEIDSGNFEISNNIPDNEVRPVQLNGAKNGIKQVHVSGRFTIIKIRYLPLEEVRIQKEYEARFVMLADKLNESWSEHIGAMLEPNHYYCLTVKTETIYSRDGNKKVHTFTDKTYFQTGNPPGAYVPPANDSTIDEIRNSEVPGSPGYPTDGALKDIGPYVEYTVPRQKASNEPNRYAYRCYNVGVVFNTQKGYVEQMFLMAGLPLRINLCDNNNDPIIGPDGSAISLDNNWGDNVKYVLSREEKQWKIFLEDSCHIALEGPDIMESIYSGNELMVLQPESFYNAIVKAGNQYDVYKFSFITSKYCHFIHHIQSFANAVWDYKKVANLNGELLTNDERNTLKDILNKLPQFESAEPGNYNPAEENLRFEQISKLLRLSHRQLPKRTEITVLGDDNRDYGFLLESSEPLEWDRIQLQIKYQPKFIYVGTFDNGEHDNPFDDIGTVDLGGFETDTPIVIRTEVAPYFGNIKFTDAKIDAGLEADAALNNEWVELLLTESQSLKDYCIKIKDLISDNYIDYFAFSDDKILPAGTIIKVHSGVRPNQDDKEDNIVHYYLGDANVDGSYKFSIAGNLFQLIDAASNVVQTRLFIKFNDSYHKFILVRNADETRAFIFLPDNDSPLGSVPIGRYRLEFCYKKKLDGLPLLLRNGLSEDEITPLEFSLPAGLLDV
ncbi:MAG: hypothetical protein AB1746_02425 [Candidatus Zixiibacteriota bacterium]